LAYINAGEVVIIASQFYSPEHVQRHQGVEYYSTPCV